MLFWRWSVQFFVLKETGRRDPRRGPFFNRLFLYVLVFFVVFFLGEWLVGRYNTFAVCSFEFVGFLLQRRPVASEHRERVNQVIVKNSSSSHCFCVCVCVSIAPSYGEWRTFDCFHVFVLLLWIGCKCWLFNDANCCARGRWTQSFFLRAAHFSFHNLPFWLCVPQCVRWLVIYAYSHRKEKKEEAR